MSLLTRVSLLGAGLCLRARVRGERPGLPLLLHLLRTGLCLRTTGLLLLSAVSPLRVGL